MSAAAPDAPARFVTLEGLEGTGKTTQLERLAARLVAAGERVLVTREPGGTALGRELRALLLRADGPAPDPWAELLLYVADRAQHLVERVEPALSAGVNVLCDRYVDATVAYQGHARGLGRERVLELHRHAPLDRRPDRTLLFDLDPAEALGRARRRDPRATDDRFEREALAFHERVRAGYLAEATADPARIRVVDAAGTVDDVGARVAAALADLWPALGVPR